MTTNDSTDRTLRIVLIVLAALVLAPMLMMVLAVPMFGMWGGGMMGGYGYGMTGGSGLWGLGMSLVWLVVLVGIGVLGYRWLRNSGGIGGDRAMEELRLTYARGELTDEEFEERRAKLARE